MILKNPLKKEYSCLPPDKEGFVLKIHLFTGRTQVLKAASPAVSPITLLFVQSVS